MQLYLINKILSKMTTSIAYIKLLVLEFKIKLIIKDNIKL